MKAIHFGIAAATLAGLALATPATALPFMGGVQPADTVQKTVVVRRVVRRGPRCDTVVTKRVGRFGRTVITKKRRCF